MFFLRLIAFLYALVAYAASLAVILYGMLFLGLSIMPEDYAARINSMTPWAIDKGQADTLDKAMLIDVLLLLAFVVPHSLMAREGFKRVLTKVVPRPIERSTYVLASSLLMALLFWQWRPIPEPIWSLADPAIWPYLTEGTALDVTRYVFQTLYWCGWAIVLLSTFMIGHFDLFGVRQAWAYLRGREPQPIDFKTPGFYRLVRHPIMLGFLIVFWATPEMNLGRLLFAAVMSGYVILGIVLEERSLVAHHGQAYLDYQRTTSMLLPLRWRRS